MTVAAPTFPTYSDTQVRIMLSAEKLFAENGIDGVSMREIAVSAQHKNPFAAQYHFGSRDGLVRAIFSYRMNQMEEARGRMLDRARRDSRLADPHTIIEMIYLPQVALVREEGGQSYASFLCQYLLRAHSPVYGDFGTPLPPNLVEILSLLRQCVPHLSDAAAQRRLVSSSLVFLHFLSVFGGRHIDQEHIDVEDEETFEARLWDTVGQIEMATLMPLAEANSVGWLEERLR